MSKQEAVLVCLPTSNATVERLFSVMNMVKTRLRNRLAVTTVNAVLAVREGMRRNGEDRTSFTPLPEMMRLFNAADMYGDGRGQGEGDERRDPQALGDGDDGGLDEVLRDVEEMLGERVFMCT